MVSKTFTSILALSVLIPAAAYAQKAPVFQPAAWEVGSTQLASARGLQDMKLPCVISTEYDNGYTLRFSGGGGSMLAMAIDFRQEVFRQGRKYNAMISIGDGYVKQVTATAFTPSTLIFNLRPLGDFYGVAKTAKQMEISIDDNVMTFGLGNLTGAYQPLESCYNGGNAATIKPMIASAKGGMPSPAPVPGVEAVAANQLPRNFDEIVQQSGGASAAPMKIAEPGSPRAPGTAMAGRVSRSIDANQWTASAGEDIKTVLSRWADRAGYDLDWQAAQGGSVAQNISVNGSFQDAVSQILAENSAATGIAGHFDTGAAAKPGATIAAWNATPGTSLQSVLDQWGAKAGVSIVWQTSINAPVKAPVNITGNFETALQSLLDQYASDSVRPVGRLNVDPSTGQRTLYMEMDRS